MRQFSPERPAARPSGDIMWKKIVIGPCFDQFEQSVRNIELATQGAMQAIRSFMGSVFGRYRVFAVMLGLLCFSLISATSVESFADEPAAAAPAAAAPTVADLEKRIADLEAYVNNGARVDFVAGRGPFCTFRIGNNGRSCDDPGEPARARALSLRG